MNDAHDARAEEIKALARDHAEEAIEALREVMNDADEKGAARVKAAEVMLARGFGAPERKIEANHNHNIVDHRAAHLLALQTLANTNRPAITHDTAIQDAEYKEVTNNGSDR